MIKTYILCNKDKEPRRFQSVENQIKKFNLSETLDIEYFYYIWGNEITQEIRKKYCKSDESMMLPPNYRSMKKKPLTNGEISLFLNYIECLKKIRKEYSDGNFIIFESDVLFKTNFNINLLKILKVLSKIKNYDTIHIGTGAGDWFKRKGYPRTQSIIIDNIYFYKENICRGAEGIIWNYKSICKFLDHFEKDENIDAPIDTKMDAFCNHLGNFNIYWSNSPLTNQGSYLNIFKSTIH